MNSNQIRHFVSIVEHGSFRRAAEILTLSQPALSMSVKSLEEYLQVQLLERRKKGVIPTPYGTVLYGYFKTALRSLHRGYREIEHMRDGASGRINVGAPTGMIDMVLPSIIERVTEQEARISFGVQYGYLYELLQALRYGELDFLLTPYWPEILLSKDLDVERLTNIFVSIYARDAHPLAKKEEVTRDDLLASRWILAQSEGMQKFHYELFGPNHESRVHSALTHNHAPFMINMLQKTDLLAIIPDYTVSQLTADGTLTKIDYSPFRPSMCVGLIRLAGGHITPSTKFAIETAKEIFRDIERKEL